MNKLKFLSGNALKILAAIAMVFDHVGLLFFPTNTLYRKIGRLAFPIFAFLLAEGCKYTRDRKKHFLQIFVLALVCQLFYLVFMSDTYLSVLVTLTLAEGCIFSLQDFKKNLFNEQNSALKKALCFLPFLAFVIATSLIAHLAQVDYGFWGCMLPVFASLTDFRCVRQPKSNLVSAPETSSPTAFLESETATADNAQPEPNLKARQTNFIEKLDQPFPQLICFTIGLICLYLFSSSILPKAYSFLALIPLLFYSGKRGKWKLKYFFYLFYPLHLVLLEVIYVIWYFLSIT